MKRRKIAVIGSGVSGLSSAWLLAKAHDVTLFEAEARLGGHAHTEQFGAANVDVGFIVFNEKTYPNFTALLRHLDVATNETEMGFSVSLDGGRFEYAGASLGQLLGTPRQAISVEHWQMLADLARFYRTAKGLAAEIDDNMSLGEFLAHHKYGQAFIHRHLIPMAAAIWSSHPGQMLDYPAKAFITFFDNHQLLVFGRRDKWRTVKGGSRNYVEKLRSGLSVVTGDAVERIERGAKATVACRSGRKEVFDDVVLACHADQALAMLAQPTALERELLSPFKFSANRVVVHRDASLMPRHKRHWSSWNYVGESQSPACGVTYWMNQLQQLETKTDHFVSLNPARTPKAELTDLDFDCTHPIFNGGTLAAQKRLWELQGVGNTWFCGAWFGAGFHEDGLQAGLAVAEQLGGVARPWRVAHENGRIFVGPPLMKAAE